MQQFYEDEYTETFEPFFEDVNTLDIKQRYPLKSLSHVYKKSGYGHFVAGILAYKKNPFIQQEQKSYIIYWIRKDLKIRWIARKFYLKLKNNIIRKANPQNSMLLDFETPSNDHTNPVYIYSNHIGGKYWVYTVGEIKKIILYSLLQCDCSESLPKVPCNVYTNEELSSSQLMNIYLQIGHLKLHPLIHSYAQRYFDLKLFQFYNNTELTNLSTKQYLKFLSHPYLLELSAYFEKSVADILKRGDIPDDVKRGVLKRVMSNEPIRNDLPLFTLHNINLSSSYTHTTKIRRYRRARRPVRTTTQNNITQT